MGNPIHRLIGGVHGHCHPTALKIVNIETILPVILKTCHTVHHRNNSTFSVVSHLSSQGGKTTGRRSAHQQTNCAQHAQRNQDVRKRARQHLLNSLPNRPGKLENRGKTFNLQKGNHPFPSITSFFISKQITCTTIISYIFSKSYTKNKYFYLGNNQYFSQLSLGKVCDKNSYLQIHAGLD